MVIKTVRKYPIQLPSVSLYMPEGAEILCVQMQGKQAYIWALVDPQNGATSRRLFEAFGTGCDIDMTEVRAYIGTWQDGFYVWHLYEMQVA